MSCADRPAGDEPNWFHLAAKAGALPNNTACYPYKQCTYPDDEAWKWAGLESSAQPGGFSSSGLGHPPCWRQVEGQRLRDMYPIDTTQPAKESPKRAPRKAPRRDSEHAPEQEATTATDQEPAVYDTNLPAAGQVPPGSGADLAVTSQVAAVSGTNPPAAEKVPTELKMDPVAAIQAPAGPGTSPLGSGKPPTGLGADPPAASQVPAVPAPQVIVPGAAPQDVVAAQGPAVPDGTPVSNSVGGGSVMVSPGSDAGQALTPTAGPDVVAGLQWELASQEGGPSSSEATQKPAPVVHSSPDGGGSAYRLNTSAGGAGMGNPAQQRSPASRASVTAGYCWLLGAVMVLIAAW
jgi:hypothetical protein